MPLPILLLAVLAADSDHPDTGAPLWSVYTLGAATALSLAGVIFFASCDVWDSPKAATRANRANSLSLAPLIAPLGRSTAVGLGVNTAF